MSAVMVIKEMIEQKCHAVLARASMGKLGRALDDQPYVVPVRFAYEPEYIYTFSTSGQKIKWRRANPKLSLTTALEVPAVSDRPGRTGHVAREATAVGVTDWQRGFMTGVVVASGIIFGLLNLAMYAGLI
jgi:hypothetical protein